MSLIKRLSIVDKAVLTATGNSNVIVGSSTEALINTSDMITLSGATTRDYTKSGSKANLSILNGSTILYAELLWYSTVLSTFSDAKDLRGIQDAAITVTMPNGDIKYIKPDEGQDFITFTTSETVRFRIANVTSLVSQYLGGTYTVSNIPTSIPSTGINNSRCGWSLNVVYRNDAFTPKKIDFMSGIAYSTSSQALQTIISGFTTPSNSSYLKGIMFLTAANGAPLTGTENVSIGTSLADLSVIGNSVESPNQNPQTAPNNPYNNFFAGLINNCNPLSSSMGLLDITGTNGVNNNDGFLPAQNVGARNKWDMTAVDISKYLKVNQTQLAFQLMSGTYSVQLMSIGTQIEAIAPDVTVGLEIYSAFGDNYNAQVGERIVYAITVQNKGEEAADNVILKLNPGSYISVVPNTIRVNNVIASGADITSGINVGTVASYGLTRVKFEAIISALPPYELSTGLHTINNSAEYSYQFVSGITKITNTGNSNSRTLSVHTGTMTIAKTASTITPAVGSAIVYTNVITNTGTQQLQNLVFQDADTPYSSFVANSVYINDVQKPGLDPTSGFALNNMDSGSIVTVKYSVVVDSVPPSKSLSTTSLVKYYYNVLENENVIFETSYSNELSLAVQYVKIIKVTSASNQYPKAGDTVTYTTTLTNVGNIDASNVTVQDVPVAGAAFVSKSVTVDGASMPDANPYTGFMLSTPIAASATSVVKYDVTVVSLPSKETVDNTAAVPYEYKITDEQGTITDTTTSNMVETLSNYVCMTMTETASRICAKKNSEIYYTVVISNTGNISATDTFFTSNIESDTTFAPGSVTINGVSYPSYSPIDGFSVGTIYPGNSTTVTYCVTVTNIPDGHVVYNQSGLTYNSLPNPTTTAVSGSLASNRVETTLNESTYTVTIDVDKSYAVISDPLIYTVTLNNTGSTSLSGIRFYDYLSSNVTFMPGTAYVNGVNYPDYNPVDGFVLSDLKAGETARIVFGVTVTSAPQAGFITNMAAFDFSYQTCSDLPAITTTVFSEDVRTYIVNGSLSLVKDTNASYAKLNDKVTYTINLVNNGNVPLKDVFFADVVPAALQFVAGSVYVNNVNQPSYDPTNGFTIGVLNDGQTVKITFDTTVASVPNPNTVNNYATAIYTYTIDPTQQPKTDSKNSNTVITVINKSDSSITKIVDRAYAAVGDTLTYTLVIKNTGTVPLNSVIFTDVLQSEAEFVIGSVVINGTGQSGYNPNQGFAVPDILAGGTATIVFWAKVASIPSSKTIVNTGSISYKYTLVPSQGEVNATRTSNPVTTNINTVSVSNVKSVDKAYATGNDIITYTSTITNTSTVSLINTKFTDLLAGDSTYIDNSVTIDGVAYPSYDPQKGFTLGTIAVGKTVVVKFQVKVAAVPIVELQTNQSNINYGYQIYPDKPDVIYADTLSNMVTTILKIGSLAIDKEADRVEAMVNDTINYRIVISNIGNTDLKTLNFVDVLQAESTFVTDSVYIDGEQKTGYDPSDGFALPDLPVGGYSVITFQATVNAMPSGDHIIYNQSDISYSYYVDPDKSPYTASKSSDITEVLVLDMIITSTKSVNKKIEKIGQTLAYTIVVKNIGSVMANNVFFKDPLVSYLQFVEQSVAINNTPYTSYNPNQGFTLGNIAAGASSTVTFNALIVSRPANNTIYNSATQTYTYTIEGTTYDGNMTTNTVSTLVAYGELSHSKYTDRMYGSVGDNITYTFLVQNTGSVNATGLIFKDIIQTDASFNTGSVSIDGVSYPTYNPNKGFSLSNLTPNTSHVITFNTKIVSMPATNRIDDTSTTTYTYRLSATDTPVTATKTSNMVSTYVNLGRLTIAKSVDKAYATIDDVITYTVNVTNTGNVVCSNVTFKDPIQTDATFVEQSVMIDDKEYSSYNPNDGFILPTIAVGATVKVTFKVKVSLLPASQFLYNTAEVNYQYYTNPTSDPVSTSAISNTVQTIINVSALSVVKAVDKDYATIGDVITYTTTVTNTGTVNASSMNFRDVINAGLTFMTGSVSVDGTPYINYNPYDSFSIPQLTPGQSTQVIFKATVTSLPNPNTVSNVANVVYSYQIEPSGSIMTLEKASNSVTTTINIQTVNIEKTVDKAYATAGEVLTYSFTLTNAGNVTLSNVMFYDNLQSDITFNTGSVIVNSSPQQSYDPTRGFSIGTMDPLAVVTLSFKVTVINSPANSSVLNFGYITFDYKINPSGETYTKTAQSNTVVTTLVLPSIEGMKTVDLAYATINNTLNYTVTVKNTGNYLLTNVNFVDTLSNGGSFVAGSVMIDGVSYPTYNPINGFVLPNLPVGKATFVQFKATVATLPSPPVITNYAVSAAKCVITQTGMTVDVSSKSNEVTTNIVVGSLSNIKSVDKSYARVGDTITFTDVITNTGNVTASSIYFKDQLQAELTFVGGSVKIGTVKYPDLNPEAGFALADMAAGAVTMVSFDAVINAMPLPPIVYNSSQATFNYKIDPTGIDYSGTAASGTTATNVVKGELTSSKLVDKTIATVGDELTYTVTITNSGNVSANDIVFTDTPGAGATFKAGSVIVNGTAQASYNPTSGFAVPSIPAGSVATVVFNVTVTSVPSTNVINNTATMAFTYLVDPKQAPYTGTATTNTVTTNIALGKLTVTKVVDKAYATIGDKLTYTISVKNVGNVNATNVKFTDPTPANTTFSSGSVTINGQSYVSYNPETGFMLGTILPGQTVTVTYQVVISNGCTA